MRRILMVAALGSFALAATSWAFEATDYNGKVKAEDSSILGFDIKHNAHGHRVETSLIVARVNYSCDSAPSGATSGYTVFKKFPIKGGRWSGHQDVTESGLDPTVTITGELKGNGVAKGTIRLKGALDDASPAATCDTGTVKWTATKGPGPLHLTRRR